MEKTPLEIQSNSPVQLSSPIVQSSPVQSNCPVQLSSPIVQSNCPVQLSSPVQSMFCTMPCIPTLIKRRNIFVVLNKQMLPHTDDNYMRTTFYVFKTTARTGCGHVNVLCVCVQAGNYLVFGQ